MDMKDTTNEMSETTKGMSETTKRMEDTTCKMYTSLRQGNSKASRDADMEAIRDGKNITEKLELAAKYMQGFEYQVWTTSCASVVPREIVIEQAATELLTAIQPYAKDRSKVAATTLSSKSKDNETLLAISATLHRTNALQSQFLEGSGEKAMTPLDIVVQGLKMNQAKNRGQLTEAKYPAWATIVGKYERDATFLLRLRANFLMAYGYAIADSDSFGNTPSLLEKIWRMKSTTVLKKQWKPNLATRDATEIRERITVALKLAKQTRDALVSLGTDPMVDETIVKVWQNADFSGFDLAAMEKKGGDEPARAKAISELISARDALLAKGATGNW